MCVHVHIQLEQTGEAGQTVPCIFEAEKAKSTDGDLYSEVSVYQLGV